MNVDGAAVIERVRELPGGPQLLAVAAEHGGVELVGGAVRDILLGGVPRELDTLVESDAQDVVDRLVERLDGEATVHERFGTALISSPPARIDLVRARVESYAAPGALPEVRPGTLDEDLARRDFTVNAIAVVLAGPCAGQVRAVAGAIDDLRARRLRVLHDDSFVDDPTRLLRLARYAARLGFEIEPHTRELARRAIDGGALSTVSTDRIGAELALTAADPDPIGAFATLDALGICGALGLPTPFDRRLADAAFELLPQDGSPGALALATLFHPAGPSPPELKAAENRIKALTTDGATRTAVSAAALGCFALSPVLVSRSPAPPSLLRMVFGGARPELVAMTGALAGRASPDATNDARRWLSELRYVTLQIDGSDLLASGVRQGPEIGERLARALDRKLDGLLDDGGREAELRAALEESV
jgi:tRNA nucleotidyltransferase (CCA-adding enzyme)